MSSVMSASRIVASVQMMEAVVVSAATERLPLIVGILTGVRARCGITNT
jgi:hypothetical protein